MSQSLSHPGTPPKAKRSRATMRDVAALAGVSLKTVSRVVNGVSSVAPELVEQVERAAQQLDFRPDLTASSLRRSDRQTRTIGLLVEDVSNPFSATLQRAIEDVAFERGFLVLAASVGGSSERERALAATLTQRRVDGLIMAPASTNQSYLFHEQQMGTPIVFVDRTPAFLDADSVVSDNRGGAHNGVAHLIAAGHTSIGFIGSHNSIPTSAARHQGFLDALDENGLDARDEFVNIGVTTIEAAEAVLVREAVRPDPPTAWFTAQNLLTIGALRALRHLGIHKRVAHVGFDDVPLAEMLNPGLTVIAQDVVGMGRSAANRLLERIDGNDEPFRTIELPTTLIARGSGEISSQTDR